MGRDLCGRFPVVRGFYYAEKARRTKILVAEEDNEIVAMLHRNPFDVVVGRPYLEDRLCRRVATAAGMASPGVYEPPAVQDVCRYVYGKDGILLSASGDPAIYLPFEFTYIFDQPEALPLSEKGC